MSRKVKDMNVQHRTSNVQRRTVVRLWRSIIYESKGLWPFIQSIGLIARGAKRHLCLMFNVISLSFDPVRCRRFINPVRSMLDVRCFPLKAGFDVHLLNRYRPLAAVRLAIISLVIAGLTGCVMGPDYKQPDLGMPDEYRQADAGQDQMAEQESLAARSWREIYKDEHLQRLIETGLANNLDLAVARSRVRVARSQLAVTRSPLFPQLGLESTGERERDSGITSTSTGPDNEFYLGGLLSWEIDLWGANRRATEAAEAQWLASKENREALAVSLIGEIATAYFDLLDIDNRIEISENTVLLREESLKISKLRRKGGVISELEVRQSAVEVAKAKAILPGLRRNRLLKENQLSVLLGQAPGDIDRSLEISTQPLPPAVPVGLPSSLLQRRPDIRLAEQDLIAANAGIGIAKTNFFPRLTLTGGLGLESDELNTLLKSAARTWILDLDVAMPIFTAGKNRAKLAIAKEQYEQAKLNYRKVVLRSLQEVSNALESYYLSKEALQARRHLVDSSREYVRLAKLRYYNGVLSYLDLLDAQRQLFDSELSLSQSKRDRLVIFVQLYKALGGGWEVNRDQ